MFSPTMKYFRKPGCALSMSAYQGSAMSSVTTTPRSHGRSRHRGRHALRTSTQKNIGSPDNTSATGPLASSPRPQPTKNRYPHTFPSVPDGGCSAFQNEIRISATEKVSAVSVITVPAVARKNGAPASARAAARPAPQPPHRSAARRTIQTISTDSRSEGSLGAKAVGPRK
jgi:hypothetical protein